MRTYRLAHLSLPTSTSRCPTCLSPQMVRGTAGKGGSWEEHSQRPGEKVGRVHPCSFWKHSGAEGDTCQRYPSNDTKSKHSQIKFRYKHLLFPEEFLGRFTGACLKSEAKLLNLSVLLSDHCCSLPPHGLPSSVWNEQALGCV